MRVIHPGASRRLVGAAVVAVLVATLVAGQWAERARGASDLRCARHAAQAAERARAVTGSGTPVTVIGDSWSVGLGLEDPTASWPSRLPGRVTVAGFSGSGFSPRASRCRDVSFADRAAAGIGAGSLGDAGLVVVQGGLNDHDQSTVSVVVGFHRLMRVLAGRRVVVVGPATAPSRRSSVARIDQTLAALARGYAVPYVRTSDLVLSYSPDRLHLSAAGHRAFGDAVAGRLAQLPARAATTMSR